MNVPSKTRYYTLSLISGCVWAAMAYALAREGLGKSVWGGVIASPIIGVTVAAIYRPACRFATIPRVLLSLATLYIAVGLFGAAVGIYEAFRIHRSISDKMVEAVLACWWGLTYTGWLVVCLWCVSFLNHSLVCRFGRISQKPPV